MRNLLLKLLLPVVLCACSTTAEVIGKAGPEVERYQGTAKFYENGSTSIEMVGTSGVECVGAFLYARVTTRIGDMICNDGRIARMRYTSLSRTSGYGYGVDGDGKQVAFFYGLPEEEADRYLALAASSN